MACHSPGQNPRSCTRSFRPQESPVTRGGVQKANEERLKDKRAEGEEEKAGAEG